MLGKENEMAQPNARAEADPRAPLCTVALCPICSVVTAMGQARPEIVEHLLAAGQQVLLALRAAIDARLAEPPPRLERLTID